MIRGFFSASALIAVLATSSASYAGTKAVQVTLPDQSVHVTVTSKKSGAIAPSMAGMVHYHCASDTGKMKCTFIQGHTADGPSALGTVAGPASFVAGMRVLRPTKGDSTYVSNDSSSRSQAEGGDARSDAYLDQSYEEDNSTRFDFWGNEGPIGIFPVLPPPPPPPPAPEVGTKG